MWSLPPAGSRPCFHLSCDTTSHFQTQFHMLMTDNEHGDRHGNYSSRAGWRQRAIAYHKEDPSVTRCLTAATPAMPTAVTNRATSSASRRLSGGSSTMCPQTAALRPVRPPVRAAAGLAAVAHGAAAATLAQSLGVGAALGCADGGGRVARCPQDLRRDVPACMQG